MVVIIIVLSCLFIFCIFGLVCSLKATAKRKNLQQQADYNFKNKNGNYQFYYSIKSFKRGSEVFVKIFTEPVLGFSDLKEASTNRFVNFKIVVNDLEVLPKIETKGLTAMGEVAIPAECIVNNELKANFTVETHWHLCGKQIEDMLTFAYGG